MKTIPSLPAAAIAPNGLQLSLSFEAAQACLLVRNSGELFVQAIDAYGFQRELSITPTVDGYAFHVYQHPGRRDRQTVNKAQGGAFVKELLRLAQSYSDLLFNTGEVLPGGHYRPRSEGFVRLCERLFQNEASVSLLR